MSRINREILDRAIRELTTNSKRRGEVNVPILVCLSLGENSFQKQYFSDTKSTEEVFIMGNEVHLAIALELNIPSMSLEELNQLSQNDEAINVLTNTYVIFMISDSIAKDIPSNISIALQMAAKFPIIINNQESIPDKIEEQRENIKLTLYKEVYIQHVVGSSNSEVDTIADNVIKFTKFMVSIMNDKWDQIRTVYLRSKTGEFCLLYCTPNDRTSAADSDSELSDY